MVEDDRSLAACARRYLEAVGHEVSPATDLVTARRLLTGRRYDMVILDLMLPDGDGLDLCRELHADGRPSVLVVSARGDGADRMLALEAGADMYLAKPYDLEELCARVACCLRRCGREEEGEASACGDLRLSRSARRATVGAHELTLTPKEFDLLAALMDTGQILPSRKLLWEVWGYAEGIRTRTLNVHIGRLRQKLATAGATKCRIVTKAGVGYGMEQVP